MSICGSLDMMNGAAVLRMPSQHWHGSISQDFHRRQKVYLYEPGSVEGSKGLGMLREEHPLSRSHLLRQEVDHKPRHVNF
mmetsp:Transcript_23011/g.63571  ORF Transcript_23011/g.63571 Transcript_23011/m.63571 type:complete len:80 (-) Transcript_23011:1309-1548(-)